MKNILFLMDPLETIKPTHDTTFVLMKAAERKKYAIHYLSKNGLSLNNNELEFETIEVATTNDLKHPFKIIKTHNLSEKNVSALFIRTDPPFDESYLMHTWFLDNLSKKIPVLNHPNGIRTVNEKIWAMQFTKFIPNTLVTRSKNKFKEFSRKFETIILKPCNGFGGSSVFKLNTKDSNLNVAFETLSQNEKNDVIVQEYIKESETGDKRILLLNGDPLGALLRVHNNEDHRNNFFAGGSYTKTIITENDKEIIATLKPELLKLGLFFVGIDIIGDKLIEVNVTSPTCLQEINILENKRLEDIVISKMELLLKR